MRQETMQTKTFTRRSTEEITVISVEHTDTHTYITAEHTGFAVPVTDRSRKIEVGEKYLLELYNGSSIAALLGRDGDLVMPRRSDEEFEEDRQQSIRKNRERDEAQLAENKEGWYALQDELPEWLRIRMNRFHENGGHKFRVGCWSYELTVCELAALYERSQGEESEETREFSEANGTSGNQHGCAKALAKFHAADPLFDAGAFPAALTPLTGDPFYKGEGVNHP